MDIKKLEQDDIDEVVELWYKLSIEFHNFIPAEY